MHFFTPEFGLQPELSKKYGLKLYLTYLYQDATLICSKFLIDEKKTICYSTIDCIPEYFR